MFTVRKIDHFFNMHGRTHSVANAILKPHRTRGESKYMLEEIYFSDICGDAENKDENGALIPINPQRAWFDNGKFRFQFPALWYQSTCNNKAIGLRSITVKPESVAFKIKLNVWKWDSSSATQQPFDYYEILGQYPPNTNIMEILSDVSAQFYNATVASSHKTEMLRLVWGYNAKTSEASFKLISLNPVYQADDKWWRLTIDVDPTLDSECGFVECFNTTEEYLSDKKITFVFNNVWNRHTLFVHASFVNGTSFQVLGMNDDFYPKPSKMYRFNGNSPDFYFELSYDGIHPQKHRFARFVIQLAYIFNDADYMAE